MTNENNRVKIIKAKIHRIVISVRTNEKEQIETHFFDRTQRVVLPQLIIIQQSRGIIDEVHLNIQMLLRNKVNILMIYTNK